MNKSSTWSKAPTKPSDGHAFRFTERAHTTALTPPQIVVQRRLGNQGIQQLLGTMRLQPKLTVSDPNDVYEQEADRVADQVMRMSGIATGIDRTATPQIHRLCPTCEEELRRQPLEEEEEPLQTKPLVPGWAVQRQGPEEEEELVQPKSKSDGTPEITAETEAAINGLPGHGYPLPDAIRSFMEPRFNADFGAVRVHTDVNAHDLARTVNAQAFTVGSNIVFGAGHYAPESERGKHLIAHELTHVMQQGGAGNNFYTVAGKRELVYGAGRHESTKTRGQWPIAHKSTHIPQHGSEREPLVQRYTAAERATCACLDWSLPRMALTARAMVGGGNLTGRTWAARFMDHFLRGSGGAEYVPIADVVSDAGGQAALNDVNARVSNAFLAEADRLTPGASASSITKRASSAGHFSGGSDLFYAMGAFSLRAEATGSVQKSDDGTQISATMNIVYRIDDLYDWKAGAGGCTPSTGETGCTANTKTVTLPIFGVICDECLNRLVIHGWASEFMVKVRGRADNYSVSGPSGFRNPTGNPSYRENQRNDP